MISVLHISDTHFLRSYEARGGVGAVDVSAYDRMLWAMGDVTGGLREALAQGCAGGVDLIVFTGDLTDDGETDDYRALRAAFDAALADAGVAGVPVLVTPGNHDHVDALRAGWFGAPAGPAGWERVAAEAGAGDAPGGDPRSTDATLSAQIAGHPADAPLAPQVALVGGVAFVTFDSARFGHPDGYVDEARITQLDTVLAELPAATPVVLATHHHLDPTQFATPAVTCPDAFWDCLAAHGVRTLLTGHTHHQAHGVVRGIPYYTTDGLSFQGDNLHGRAGVGFTRAWGFNRYEIDAAGLVRHAEAHTFTDGRSLGEVIFGR